MIVPGRLPVPSAALRTFLALVRVYERDGRATIRAVADEQHRSVSTTHGALLHLADLGLVAGVGDATRGALRPLLRPVARVHNVSARRPRRAAA